MGLAQRTQETSVPLWTSLPRGPGLRGAPSARRALQPAHKGAPWPCGGQSSARGPRPGPPASGPLRAERGAQRMAGRVVGRRGDPSLTRPCHLSPPVPLHQPPHGRQVDVAVPVVLLGRVPVVRTRGDAGFLRPAGLGEAGLGGRGRRRRGRSPAGSADGELLRGGFRSRTFSRPRPLSVI